MKNVERWFETRLNYTFSDVQLLQQALTHRSVGAPNNERLEYLGDAVLDFVISDSVYRMRADADEGDLSKLRASLVKESSLADLAKKLDVGAYLILGPGERKSGGHRRASILADALEALIGAVYLDGRIEAAIAVIDTIFADRLHDLPSSRELRDPKTRLQEWLQSRKLKLPDYELVTVSGKDHMKTFEVSCRVAEKEALTLGRSTTRRKAEQRAAMEMLRVIGADKA